MVLHTGLPRCRARCFDMGLSWKDTAKPCAQHFSFKHFCVKCVLCLAPYPYPFQPSPTAKDPNPPPSSSPKKPTRPPSAAKLFEAALLQNQYKESEALAKYQEVLKANPRHYLALWQSAVLSIKIGQPLLRRNPQNAPTTTKPAAYADLRPGAAAPKAAKPITPPPWCCLQPSYPASRPGPDAGLPRPALAGGDWPPSAAPTCPMPGSCWAAGSTGWPISTCWNGCTAGFFWAACSGGATSLKAIESLEARPPARPQPVAIYCYDLARMYRYQGSRLPGHCGAARS